MLAISVSNRHTGSRRSAPVRLLLTEASGATSAGRSHWARLRAAGLKAEGGTLHSGAAEGRQGKSARYAATSAMTFDTAAWSPASVANLVPSALKARN